EIYATTDILSGGNIVIKFRYLEMGRILQCEHRIQKTLAGSIAAPRVWWFGTDFGIEGFVMDHQGPSLELLLSRKHSHKLPVVTVANIGCQLISLLEIVHARNFVHHHLKPSHVLSSFGSKRSNLTLIDFGLAHAYHEPKTHRHIAYKKQVPFAGNHYFVSIRALRGRQQSHRNDFESVSYILIYLLCGALLWQDDDPIPEIIQFKANICQSSLHESVPPEFFSLLKYTRSLAFDARPDYNFIRSYFDHFHTDSLTAANWGDI
ncbi:kinase-like domain-containing protein, partial [Boletus coccyginus]